jgi:hypothetical protein
MLSVVVNTASVTGEQHGREALSTASQIIVEPEQALPLKMTHAAGDATTGEPPVLHAAIGLAEQIRAASDEIERGRRIPQGIAAAMKDAGVLGMAMPGHSLNDSTQDRRAYVRAVLIYVYTYTICGLADKPEIKPAITAPSLLLFKQEQHR